jgi:hypothetical protein
MKAPNEENFSVLRRARATASNRGESFIVFCSGLAVFEHEDKRAAQDFARGQVAGGKRRDSVVIRSLKLPSTRI